MNRRHILLHTVSTWKRFPRLHDTRPHLLLLRGAFEKHGAEIKMRQRDCALHMHCGSTLECVCVRARVCVCVCVCVRLCTAPREGCDGSTSEKRRAICAV